MNFAGTKERKTNRLMICSTYPDKLYYFGTHYSIGKKESQVLPPVPSVAPEPTHRLPGECALSLLPLEACWGQMWEVLTEHMSEVPPT